MISRGAMHRASIVIFRQSIVLISLYYPILEELCSPQPQATFRFSHFLHSLSYLHAIKYSAHERKTTRFCPDFHFHHDVD